MSSRNPSLENLNRKSIKNAKEIHLELEREPFRPIKLCTWVRICQSISSTPIALTLHSWQCCTDSVCQSCSQWLPSLYQTRDLLRESRLHITTDNHQLWTTHWVIQFSLFSSMLQSCFCSTVTGWWTIDNSSTMPGIIKTRWHSTCGLITYQSTEFASHHLSAWWQ